MNTALLAAFLGLLPLAEGSAAAPPATDRGVAVVTSLADSGPGTLRAVLGRARAARIVFGVGGTIVLREPIVIRRRSSITIDGETAPAPGITLRGHGLLVRDSRDVVLRHLRVRAPAGDGIGIKRSHRIVVDHCSLTNARDENLSVVNDSSGIVVSWSLIGFDAVAAAAGDGKGMLVASFEAAAVTNVSIQHNLFVNATQRSPQISSPGLFDIRSNVIAHWDAYGIRIRNGGYGNIVDNVFRTSVNPQKAVLLAPDAGRVHIAGNVGPAGWDVNTASTAGQPFAVGPWAAMAGPADPAEARTAMVLARAGAWPRDTDDERLVARAGGRGGP